MGLEIEIIQILIINVIDYANIKLIFRFQKHTVLNFGKEFCISKKNTST